MKKKSWRFQEGLHPLIKEIVCLEIKDCTKLVKVAAIAERGLQCKVVAVELRKNRLH